MELDKSDLMLTEMHWPNAVCIQLWELRESQVLCDVSIHPGDSKTPMMAHSATMAASSPYLRSILLNASQGNQGTYTLKTANINTTTWKAILRFIYTGCTQVSKQKLWDLKVAAEKLQLEVLHFKCNELIASQLCSERSSLGDQRIVPAPIRTLTPPGEVGFHLASEAGAHVKNTAISPVTSPDRRSSADVLSPGQVKKENECATHCAPILIAPEEPRLVMGAQTPEARPESVESLTGGESSSDKPGLSSSGVRTNKSEPISTFGLHSKSEISFTIRQFSQFRNNEGLLSGKVEVLKVLTSRESALTKISKVWPVGSLVYEFVDKKIFYGISFEDIARFVQQAVAAGEYQSTLSYLEAIISGKVGPCALPANLEQAMSDMIVSWESSKVAGVGRIGRDLFVWRLYHSPALEQPVRNRGKPYNRGWRKTSGKRGPRNKTKTPEQLPVTPPVLPIPLELLRNQSRKPRVDDLGVVDLTTNNANSPKSAHVAREAESTHALTATMNTFIPRVPPILSRQFETETPSAILTNKSLRLPLPENNGSDEVSSPSNNFIEKSVDEGHIDRSKNALGLPPSNGLSKETDIEKQNESLCVNTLVSDNKTDNGNDTDNLYSQEFENGTPEQENAIPVKRSRRKGNPIKFV